MDALPALGTSIMEVLMPTFNSYQPLLKANAVAIRSVHCKTYNYGSHTRQKLDIHQPASPRLINNRQAVLVFAYGGGLVQGARTLPVPMFEKLVHANVGAFFALDHGYTVVVVDYRLLSHQAKFPSGGEDIALAVKWLCDNPEQVSSSHKAIDLFVMANSAGGIHLSTFLLHPSFASTREIVLKGEAVRLRGAILLGVPFDFATDSDDAREQTLMDYFGDLVSNSPLGLLKSASKTSGSSDLDFVTAGVRLLVLTAVLDPESEILAPNDRFIHEWTQLKGPKSRTALATDVLIGHNHISPIMALGTGVEREEAWGVGVAAFCDGLRKFAPT